MSVVRKELVIAANAVVDNVFVGSIFEFLETNSTISMGMTQSATGLVASFNVGSDTVLEESPVPIKTTFPAIPDDMDIQDVGVSGERLVLRVRNTTAGALTFRMLAQIQPAQ